MNSGLEHDVSIEYYDGDYPSLELSAYPENVDAIVEFQGLAHDVARYREIATEIGGPILELCCGTGRVAIPLARDGHLVTAVDVSEGMLTQFRVHLKRQGRTVASRIRLFQQDLTQLALPTADYRLAIVAFNSLLCITDFEGQLKALDAIARHLVPGGTLVLDIVNPLNLKIQGDPVPKPFFTRKNPRNGLTYTRFAMVGAFNENHRQELYGWYDEIASDGHLKRRPYALAWRPIFRHEISLMLERSGFELESLEGGHRKESYTAQSPRMFIIAEKRGP